MNESSLRHRHAIACVAYVIGYPFLVMLFMDFGVFDFMLPVVEVSLFDLMVEPEIFANACRQSVPCTLSHFAYFLVPLEITRRGVKLLFRGPMFPSTAQPWLRRAIHFGLWLFAIAVAHAATLPLVGDQSLNRPWEAIAGGLSLLVAAGLATRHSTRVRRRPSKLFEAALAGDAQTVLDQLSAGADPNSVRHEDGATPLHVAVRAGQPEVVATLLASKADPQMRDHAGATPLHLAAAAGDIASLNALLDAGADPNAYDGDAGRTPLSYAEENVRTEAIAALRARMNEQASSSPNSRDG